MSGAGLYSHSGLNVQMHCATALRLSISEDGGGSRMQTLPPAINKTAA
jgi:hypothetical protein